MIKLEIEGVTAEDFADQVRGFMALLSGVAAVAVAAPAAEAPGKPTPRKAKAATTETSAAPSADAVPSPTATASTTGAASAEPASTATEPVAGAATADNDGPHTLESVKKRAMLYTQSAGPQPLVEMLKLAGSENGKFSEVDALGQPAIDKVAAALAAAGF